MPRRYKGRFTKKYKRRKVTKSSRCRTPQQAMAWAARKRYRRVERNKKMLSPVPTALLKNIIRYIV